MLASRLQNFNNYEVDLSGADFPFAVEPAIQKKLQRLQSDLRHPERYTNSGVQTPQRVLISGAPGTGKTSLAGWLALEAKVRLFRLSLDQLAGEAGRSTYQGLQMLFKQAGENAPAIVLVDDLHELDTEELLVEERELLLSQIYHGMQSLNGRAVLLLLATRHPEFLGTDWFSAGRIEQQVQLGLPESLTRLAILRLHSRSLALAFDVNLISLARSTAGLSGANLAWLCQKAGQLAAEKQHTRVGMADFQAAMERFLLDHADIHLADEA